MEESDASSHRTVSWGGRRRISGNSLYGATLDEQRVLAALYRRKTSIRSTSRPGIRQSYRRMGERFGKTSFRLVVLTTSVIALPHSSRSCIFAQRRACSWGSPWCKLSSHRAFVGFSLRWLQGNVLVDNDGNARLSDFGLALVTESSSYAYGSSHGGGAIPWKAPELIDNEEFDLPDTRPTPSSDVFSFACMCVEVSKPVDYLM